MGLSDRASSVTPDVSQLLYNEEVQQAIGRAGSATRDVYSRARGKTPQEAISDKKLRRRLQQALTAAREAWSAVEEPPRRHRGRRLTLAALLVGGAAAFVAVNAKARENLLGRLGKNEAEGENETVSENEVVSENAS